MLPSGLTGSFHWTSGPVITSVTDLRSQFTLGHWEKPIKWKPINQERWLINNKYTFNMERSNWLPVCLTFLADVWGENHIVINHTQSKAEYSFKDIVASFCGFYCICPGIFLCGIILMKWQGKSMEKCDDFQTFVLHKKFSPGNLRNQWWWSP